MNSSIFMKAHTKVAVLTCVLVVVFGLSARAAVSYTFNYTDSGPIPQDGTVFSAEQTVSGIGSPIQSIELLLTFDNGASLTPSSTIQGLLNLGITGSATSVSFTPTISYAGTGSQKIYDVTFSDFNGLNPNDTWSLVLWDTSSSGIENGLAGWSLTVVVPEPVDMALAVFGLLFVGVGVGRSYFRRHRSNMTG
jgi:hypothetical protein